MCASTLCLCAAHGQRAVGWVSARDGNRARGAKKFCNVSFESTEGGRPASTGVRAAFHRSLLLFNRKKHGAERCSGRALTGSSRKRGRLVPAKRARKSGGEKLGKPPTIRAITRRGNASAFRWPTIALLRYCTVAPRRFSSSRFIASASH